MPRVRSLAAFFKIRFCKICIFSSTIRQEKTNKFVKFVIFGDEFEFVSIFVADAVKIQVGFDKRARQSRRAGSGLMSDRSISWTVVRYLKFGN